MKTPSASVIKLYNNKEELLLLCRNKGPLGWGLPGGKIDPGETPSEAAVRELFEETGIQLDVTGISFVKMSKSSDNRLVYVFTALLPINEEDLVISEAEHSDYVLISNPNELDLAGNTSYFIADSLL